MFLMILKILLIIEFNEDQKAFTSSFKMFFGSSIWSKIWLSKFESDFL